MSISGRPPSGPITLIAGIPGAGKTSVARALAERSARSVHLESDRFGEEFIVNGVVHPGAEPARESDRQLLVRRHNLCAVAGAYADIGFTVVIDDVIVWPGGLSLYRRLLAPRPLRFVVLAPRLEVAAQRDAGRDKHVFDAWAHLDADLRAWRDQPGVRLDTSELTLDQTVDLVAEQAPGAELPPFAAAPFRPDPFSPDPLSPAAPGRWS